MEKEILSENGKEENIHGEGVTSGEAKEEVTKTEVTYEITSPSEESQLRYRLTEIPPVPISLFVALQHVLISLASALSISSVVSDVLCADQNHSIRAQLFATTLFMQGICTVTQTLFGVRLPVFQGPSSSFLVPLTVLGRDPSWACPDPDAQPLAAIHGNGTNMLNMTEAVSTGISLNDKLRQLSGSLIIASLIEVVIGGVGIIGPLLKRIGPLTVAPAIALIGISLFKLPVIYAKFNPAIALGSSVLVVFFSLYLSRVTIPLPGKDRGGNHNKFPVFQLIPILLAMVVMWGVCGIMTITDYIPNDPSHPYFYSRTDSKISIVERTPWIQLTYPGQFGWPSISVAATVGFMAAVLASFVESVGDYFAAAKCCDVMPPPDHAISRGILLEGLGSVLSGAVGAAHATTSYSGNIAMLNLTKTASRSVLVLAGIMLILLSLIGKVAACLAALPPPILGGILLPVFGLLAALGISTLKYADMTSNRNLLLVGMAFLGGLAIPHFVETHPEMLATGNESADQVLRVVLGTPMFLGGLIALILDNTVPGTDIERGLAGWRASHLAGKKDDDEDDDDEDCKTDDKNKYSDDSEDAVYAFRPLAGRLPRSFRFLPFVPPSAVRHRDGSLKQSL